ncbi:MAG TPA: CSLREA domain-containing protein [Rudaea sp.]|nr:CSLREA domain-containing protein [Rudaea sp.]
MFVSQLFRSTVAAAMMLAAVPAFADFIVNTDSDADDGSDGVCSLREAIIAVNTQANYHECTSVNTGESAVSFAIPPGAGETHVIALNSALPAISHFINIDATGQNGATCTPIPNLRVQISNPSGLAIDGLTFDFGSDFSSVSGLVVSGFSSTQKAGLLIASNDVAVSCMISGTNASATSAAPNYYGIYINGQSASIGVASSTAWSPNLISGNSKTNIYVDAGGADTVISGNYIGVDASGVTPLPSTFGIYANGVAGLQIGNPGGDGPVEHRRNIIGISSVASTTSVDVEFVNSIDNVLAGNYIGVAGDGQTAIPIGSGIAVVVFKGTRTLIGCDGNTAADNCRNLISNGSGIAIQNFEGSDSTAVVSNFIGVAADGTTAFPGNVNTIGIDMLGADTLVARNYITTGNSGIGIRLGPNSLDVTPVFLNQTTAGSQGATLDSSDNCVQGNAIGGVLVNDASNPTVASTDFVSNWWGAADGPAPNGSGNAASSNVNYAPFLTAPSIFCGLNPDHIFANGFE